MNFTKTMASVLVSTALLASPSYATFEDFTIDESIFNPAFGTAEGDLLNGGYVEALTFSDPDGNPATPALDFVVTAVGDFTALRANEGTTAVTTLLNTNPAAADAYDLYAVFTSSGSVADPLNPVFVGNAGSFELYADVDQDTTKSVGPGGADPATIGNNADDILLAFSNNLTMGSGSIIAGIGGFFDLTFEDFTLTSAADTGDPINGESYFVDPSPFYMKTVVDGDYNEFVPAVGDLILTGDVSAVFEVPAPAPLALIGLALLGLGAARRRV